MYVLWCRYGKVFINTTRLDCDRNLIVVISTVGICITFHKREFPISEHYKVINAEGL